MTNDELRQDIQQDVIELKRLLQGVNNKADVIEAKLGRLRIADDPRPAPITPPGPLPVTIPNSVVSDNEVAESSIETQMTPLVASLGRVFNSFVRGINRRGSSTVIQHSVHDGDIWLTEERILETRTALDKWHNCPSLGIDASARIHAAYNMHNYPWQYSASRNPLDIDEFEFRGERISQADIDRHIDENQIIFPHAGLGDIPGQQVTYPHFAQNDGSLVVGYRAARFPSNKWVNRQFSGYVGVYDPSNENWVSKVIGSRPGWTVYNTTPAITPDGDVWVMWAYREGAAGARITRPCLARLQEVSDVGPFDGYEQFGVPGSDTGELNTIASLAVSNTEQAVLTHRTGGALVMINGRRIRAPGVHDLKYYDGALYGAGTDGMLVELRGNRFEQINRGQEHQIRGSYAKLSIDNGVAYIRSISPTRCKVSAFNL